MIVIILPQMNDIRIRKYTDLTIPELKTQIQLIIDVLCLTKIAWNRIKLHRLSILIPYDQDERIIIQA